MCNLYANIATAEAMRRLFRIDGDDDHLGNAPMRDSIRPNYPAPIVRLSDKGNRELVETNWGFLTPQFSKRDGSPIKPKPWNNARDDSIFGKGAGLWKESFQKRRCLVPASSFCETKGRNPAEYYWFGLAAENADDRPPFAVAGLWREEPPDLCGDVENGLRHTMVTTKANDMVAPIHAVGRMPAILEPEDWETWLHGSPDEAFGLLRPLSSAKMRVIKHGLDEKRDFAPEIGGDPS